MNKTILITGATDGIGKQITYELADAGYHLILHGRNEEKCKRTVVEIKEKFPGSAIEHISADFTSLSNARKMAETIQKRYHRLDILINNAGIYNTNKEISPDGYEVNLVVNYLAVYVLTKKPAKFITQKCPSARGECLLDCS